MSTLAMAVLSIGLSVAAQFCLKAGMSSADVRTLLAQPLGVRAALEVLTNAFVVGGLLLYAFGAVAWLGVLSKWDVSKAYPLVGTGFAVTVLIGMFAGEHVTPVRVLGVALICAGVWVVGRT